MENSEEGSDDELWLEEIQGRREPRKNWTSFHVPCVDSTVTSTAF